MRFRFHPSFASRFSSSVTAPMRDPAFSFWPSSRRPSLFSWPKNNRGSSLAEMMFGDFDHHFGPAFTMKMLQRNHPFWASHLQQFSFPRYSVVDNDKLFQVKVDVPGMTLKDINVTFDDDNNVLSISGCRESDASSDDNNDDKNNSHHYQKYQVMQRFSLDPNVTKVDELTASLKNGVLTVEAPKDYKEVEEQAEDEEELDNIRKIKIATHDEDKTTTVDIQNNSAMNDDEAVSMQETVDSKKTEK